MFKTLTGLFSHLADILPKQVLASLGIGLITSGTLVLSVNALISQVDSSWSGLTGISLQFASLLGAPEGFGIIIGAVIARISLTQFGKLGIVS